MASSSGQPVFTIRVSLLDVDPVVWRRLLVPGGIRLARLSDILLADRSHPDHDELTRWLGGPFDPRHFDLAEVNVELQRLARS